MQHQREQEEPKLATDEAERRVVEQVQDGYSARVVELAHNPKNLGRLPEPDVRGLVHGWCGDTMEIYLRLQGEKIERATFTTDGCGATLACGSAVTSLVQGMSVREASDVRPEHVIEILDGLPVGNQHCAELAVSTLQNAIFNWRASNEMWGDEDRLAKEGREREEPSAPADQFLRRGDHYLQLPRDERDAE